MVLFGKTYCGILTESSWDDDTHSAVINSNKIFISQQVQQVDDNNSTTIVFFKDLTLSYILEE